MTLRQSETVLRLLVGLALGFGFLGFATHSRAEHAFQSAHLHGALLAPASADLAR